MSARMSTLLVAEITSSVLAATNLEAEKTKIVEETKVRARELVLVQVPPGLLKMVEVGDPRWFNWISSVYLGRESVAWNPQALVQVGTPERDQTRYVVLSASIPSWGENLKAPQKQDFADLTLRAKKWAARREDLECGIRSYLLSCTTVEKAIEGMPELARHVPAKAQKKAYPLVAPSGVLSKLKAAGFDQGAKS